MVQTTLDSFISNDVCQPCKFYQKKYHWFCFCDKRASRCNKPMCKKYGLEHGIKVGSEICEHEKQRSSCKICGSCPHGKRRHVCWECDGASICDHKILRSTCRECGGNAFCDHGKRRSVCHECGGGSICEHKVQRRYCSKCEGSQICEHKLVKDSCKLCGGEQYLIRLRRGRRRHALKDKNPTHAIDDLCMTPKEWGVYLHELFEVRYGRPKTEDDRVQIDEIIPCYGWNLPDDNKYCWHYLNSQWLIDIEGARENQEKGTKYTEEDKRAMIQRIDEWFTSNQHQQCSTSSP